MLEKQSGAKPVKPDPVALHKIDISVRIDGLIAESWLNFVFINNEDTSVETSFCLPLAAGAVACDLVYEDDEIIEKACFLNTDKAFEAYDRSIDDYECGVLLEHLNKGILVLRISNLSPGRRITVRLKIVSLLHECDKIIRYELPLFITPRYVPHDMDWAENGVEVPEYVLMPPYELSISCTVKGVPFKNLRSPTHQLEVLGRSQSGESELKVSTRNMFDFSGFVLDMDLDREILPLCGAGELSGGKTAFLMQFKPDFDFPPDLQLIENSVIFMLDCSNSMQGELFSMAVDYLVLAVKWLNPGDLFNICLYGDRTLLLSPEPLLYNCKTLDAAISFLHSATPDMGGSELIEALKKVNITNVDSRKLHDIVLITDGDIYNTDEVISFVKNNLPDTRFFTCGVGVDSPQYLVRGLAEETGGSSETIEPFDDNVRKVLRQISRIFQPRLNNIVIKAVDAMIDFIVPGPEMVFDGDILTLCGVISSLGENPGIVLSGTVCGQTLLWRLSLNITRLNELVPFLLAGDLKFNGAPDVVGDDKSLFAAIPLSGDVPDELAEFRPIPVARCTRYERPGYTSMIHEEAAGYGGVSADPFRRCLELAHKQTADGAIVTGGEPVADTGNALQVLQKFAWTGELFAPAIRKAANWLKKNSSL